MNTDVVVLAPGLSAHAERQLVRRVADLFEESEKRFSRFRPDSELSHLNRSGRLEHASGPFIAALDRASDFARRTQGRFNPAVGGALIAAGYDRSFSAGQMGKRSGLVESGPTIPFEAVVIDRLSGSVTLPPGVVLDLGGFIKGWTVDQAAELLPANAVIDAGGDVLLRGAGPDGQGWIVDVEDPTDPMRDVLTLRVRDRAVATSAPNRRRWRTMAGEMHHLIDPRTSRPVDSDLAQVTVIGQSVEEAEVLAKTAFLCGLAEGWRFLQRQPGIAAVLVRLDGRLDIVGKVEAERAA